MGSASPSSIWLITGASQGLGLEIALAALKAGHKVIAGARTPEKAATEHPELEKAGGKWLKLDVTSTETAKVVADAVAEAGGIDVVVNNAGYFLPGSIEDLGEEEMHKNFETNYFGAIRVLKGALPTMRAQKSGTIVANASIFGFYACPGGAMYSSSKAALELLYETLKTELAPFNIRSIVVEAGMFRTSFLQNTTMPENGLSEHYMTQTAIGKAMQIVGSWIQEPEQHIAGDPKKFGDCVVGFVDGTGLSEGLKSHTRLLMGRDAVELAQKKMDLLSADFKAVEKIAVSADYEGHTAKGVALVADL